MDILPLGAHFVQKIWGGTAFTQKSKGDPIGEVWAVSDLEEGSSLVGEIPLKEKLSRRLPYLIKFIDTADNLSIQVHPDDVYAKRNENSKGKDECWIILEASPNAGIYLGFEQEVNAAEFKKLVLDGADVSGSLRYIPVKRGDFFFVPAGTIHAIGKGIMLAEVQQSSGITYRVWDWNRLDENGQGRELHLDKSMDVIRFDKEFNSMKTFCYRQDILNFDFRNVSVIDHDDFNLKVINLKQAQSVNVEVMQTRASAIVCLSGSISLKSSKQVDLNSYESLLLTHDKDENIEVSITAKTPCHLIFVS